MTTHALAGKTAIVVGASSGVGRETVKRLVAEGVEVVAVARTAAALESLRAEAGQRVRAVVGDGADPGLVERVLREVRPDLLVLSLGVQPHMGAIDEMSWEQFSEAWNVDLRAAFHWTKGAFQAPLAPGSSIVIVSSGAAINGSPLSGGYAGAKRMQWLMATYSQRQSDARRLGIRTIAVLPTQLIEGTKIAEVAATTYGATQGIDATEYMRRWERPLDAGMVAAAIVGALRGEVADGVTAIGVSGKGVEPLP